MSKCANNPVQIFYGDIDTQALILPAQPTTQSPISHDTIPSAGITYSVIAKYVGHARHNFEMSGREFKHCRTFCAAVVDVEELSGRENKVYWTFPNSKMSDRESKWSDILSGTPEIILAIIGHVSTDNEG